jgi:hypothetical protein
MVHSILQKDMYNLREWADRPPRASWKVRCAGMALIWPKRKTLPQLHATLKDAGQA